MTPTDAVLVHLVAEEDAIGDSTGMAAGLGTMRKDFAIPQLG